MSSRYSKWYYRDVAQIFARYSRGLHDGVVKDFADLFAADNPQTCLHCGVSQPNNSVCPDGSGILPHHLTGGFDRERFLAACGLEPGASACSTCSNPSGGVYTLEPGRAD